MTAFPKNVLMFANPTSIHKLRGLLKNYILDVAVSIIFDYYSQNICAFCLCMQARREAIQCLLLWYTHGATLPLFSRVQTLLQLLGHKDLLSKKASDVRLVYYSSQHVYLYICMYVGRSVGQLVGRYGFQYFVLNNLAYYMYQSMFN